MRNTGREIYQKAIRENMLLKHIQFVLYNNTRFIKNYIKYAAPAKMKKTIWVETDDISHYIEGVSLNRRTDLGTIMEGDWDQTSPPINDHWIYQGIVERFVDEKEWKNTVYVKRGAELIEKRGSFWGCSSREEFIESRCKYVDELYNSIKEEGYKPQEEATLLDKARHKSNYYARVVEIAVGIGRDGEILLYDGFHRLTIAKILDIDEIPVTVLLRHKEWQKKRDEISQYGQNQHIRNFDHPDLHDI